MLFTKKKLLISALLFIGMNSYAQLKKSLPKTELVEMQVTDVRGRTKTITIDLVFPKGPGNTGNKFQTDAVAKIGAALKSQGVVCKPKRKKIGDNVWICGDGTRYQCDNKKLKAILELLWIDGV